MIAVRLRKYCVWLNRNYDKQFESIEIGDGTIKVRTKIEWTMSWQLKIFYNMPFGIKYLSIIFFQELIGTKNNNS
jgi:hypothetical protein